MASELSALLRDRLNAAVAERTQVDVSVRPPPHARCATPAADVCITLRWRLRVVAQRDLSYGGDANAVAVGRATWV